MPVKSCPRSDRRPERRDRAQHRRGALIGAGCHGPAPPAVRQSAAECGLASVPAGSRVLASRRAAGLRQIRRRQVQRRQGRRESRRAPSWLCRRRAHRPRSLRHARQGRGLARAPVRRAGAEVDLARARPAAGSSAGGLAVAVCSGQNARDSSRCRNSGSARRRRRLARRAADRRRRRIRCRGGSAARGSGQTSGVSAHSRAALAVCKRASA